MAKQMRRVEKRYVPQQESYRSLPALSQQASPVDVTPEAPIDTSAEKLRQLAEGLSSLNKGLGDFLRMEKSFEETNRLEAQTRARLGMDIGEGKGLLDLGLKQGYEQGKGIDAAERVSMAVRKKMIDLDPEFTHENFGNNIDKLRGFVDNMVDETLAEQGIDLNTQSRGFLEGAGAEIAKIKLEARVEAAKKVQDNAVLGTMSLYSTKVRNTFEELLPQIKDNLTTNEVPREQVLDMVRLKLADLSKVGRDQMRINRDTANAVAVSHLTDTFKNQWATLKLNPKATFNDYRLLEESAALLMESLDRPHDGVRLTDSGHTETRQAISQLRNTAVSMNTEIDMVRERKTKMDSSKLLASYVTKMFTGDMTYGQAQENIKQGIRSGTIDPEVSTEVIDKLYSMYSRGSLFTIDAEEYKGYMAKALSGKMTEVEAMELSFDKQWPKDTLTNILGAINAVNSVEALRHTKIMRGFALDNAERQQRDEVRRETLRTNKQLIEELLSTEKLSGDELKYIKEDCLSPLVNDIDIALLDREEIQQVISAGRSAFSKYLQTKSELSTGIDPYTTYESTKVRNKQLEDIASLNGQLELYPPGSSKYAETIMAIQTMTEQLKRQRKTQVKFNKGVPAWNQSTPIPQRQNPR